MSSGHKMSDMPSRYQPLFDLLAATTGDEVTLTYKEVAALIGGPLPETAIFQSGWWTSKANRTVQSVEGDGWVAHPQRRRACGSASTRATRRGR